MPKLLVEKRVGRPCLPDGQKKTRVSVTISPKTLLTIDHNRRSVSRSEFLESLIKNSTEQSRLSRIQLRKNGIVYTPSHFADFIAMKVSHYYLNDSLNTYIQIPTFARKIRILDPACGNGELLKAIWDNLLARIGNQNFKIDPRNVLCGVDIDYTAVKKTRLRINALARESGFRDKVCLNVRQTNGLFPYNQSTTQKGWDRIKQEFDAEKGFDIVIANPPWGADTKLYRDKLSQKEFSLFQGQFDTSDLFVESALSICRPGGYIAFIVPDSLFAQERESLRKLLLQRTHIRFLGRFGEKIFSNINRACAVFICKVEPPRSGARIDCLRLTVEARKHILTGSSTFSAEDERLRHSIPQSRLINNKGYIFDIDVEEKEESIFYHFAKQEGCLGDHLISTRGVELSKYGRIYLCVICKKWLPYPISENPRCHHCGCPISIHENKATTIVYETQQTGCQPFLVGENISRYALKHTLWISTQYAGINYKEYFIYKSPKLVVRKTGVGVSAAIDYSDAYTNQVVYIFRQKKNPEIILPLEFFLGILNSRAIYYFITKQNGETEWRSHPYITQRQILSLPLPKVDRLEKKINVVNQITRLLRPYTELYKEPPVHIDAEVEKLIAQLYDLTKEHYERIYTTIENVQELLPIRALKKVSIGNIFT